jgi:all-trans-retinol 13,14-reductase
VSWIAGGLLRRRFLRLARRTTRETLEQWTKDQRLIAVLTGQFGDYGLPPSRSSFAIHAMVANHYMNGGYYPVGGAAVLARGAIERIESHGGRVLVGATVDRIVADGNRATGVRMEDGRVFLAPIVISDAGAGLTLGHLTRDLGGPIAGLRDRISGLGRSTAHLGLYVGLEGTDEELGLEGTNLWIYPDENHEANIDRFLADPEAPVPLAFVSFPSSKDPDFRNRHPGHSTIDVVTLASWDWFSRWKDLPWKKRGEEYEALKERFARRLLEILFRHVPRAKGALKVYEVSSPLSTRKFAAWERGEIYGLDHTPERFAERGLRPRTPLSGLFLTGQDVCTCGVTGAMLGGALTASAVLGRPVIRSVLEG